MIKAILVDDEYMIVQGLRKLINWKELGIECVGTFSDGLEALEYVRENPVDIVVTDVSMPRMSGIEFVREAQTENINFHFVILSGYQEFEYVQQGIKLGAENFILKPIDAIELNDTLRKTVAKLHNEKDLETSHDLLYKNTIIRWLSDDIDPVDFKRIMTQMGVTLDLNSLYSVLIIDGIQQNRQAFWTEFLHGYNQNLFYFEHDHLVMVIVGSNLVFDSVHRGIVDAIIKDQELLGLGELFVEFDLISRSYNHAESYMMATQFYGQKSFITEVSVKEAMKGSTDIFALSFEGFHQALSLGDISLVLEEVQKLLGFASAINPHPDYVRYVAFVILSDIYRQHVSISGDSPEVTFSQLSESKSLNDILDIIKDSLKKSYENAEIKSLNANVQEAIKIVYSQYVDDITIGGIAEELHLNAMYLGQIFKKETGKSFSQFLNHYRIQEAQKLLLQSSHNINEIASLVGYTSSGYFYKNFKKECGLSPKEYRDRYLESGMPNQFQ